MHFLKKKNERKYQVPTYLKLGPRFQKEVVEMGGWVRDQYKMQPRLQGHG